MDCMARGQEWNEFFQFAGPSFDVVRDVIVRLLSPANWSLLTSAQNVRVGCLLGCLSAPSNRNTIVVEAVQKYND